MLGRRRLPASDGCRSVLLLALVFATMLVAGISCSTSTTTTTVASSVPATAPGRSHDGAEAIGASTGLGGGGSATSPSRRPPERVLDGTEPHLGRRDQEVAAGEGEAQTLETEGGDDLPPAPSPALSVTLIAAIAGGGAAFVVAFGLVVYVCHRGCCRSKKKHSPSTGGFGFDGKVPSGITAATDPNKGLGGPEDEYPGVPPGGGSKRGLFPVPIVVDVEDGGVGLQSLDDTTLEGRSVNKDREKRGGRGGGGGGGTTPSTSASSRTPTPRSSGGNSPYGYLESPPRAIGSDNGGGNGRGGSSARSGDRGGGRVYVDVEKRSVGSSDDGSESFASPFQVRRSGVALEDKGESGRFDGFDDAGSKFGTPAPGGFEIDYEDGLIFPAEAAAQRPVQGHVQVQAHPAGNSVPQAASSDPWGGAGFVVDAKDEEENVLVRPDPDSATSAWDAKRYDEEMAPRRHSSKARPSSSKEATDRRAAHESGDRNFFRNGGSSAADFRDNIELGMDEFDVPAPATAPAPTGKEASDPSLASAGGGGRPTRKEPSDRSLASSSGHRSGSRPGSEASSSLASQRLRATSPFLAKYLDETRAKPELADVPDPEDSYLDEHDSSSDEDGAAAAAVRSPTPAAPPNLSTPSPVPRRESRTNDRAPTSSSSRARASSPSPSAVSATPSSSSGGVKKEGDYGPDLRLLRGISGGGGAIGGGGGGPSPGTVRPSPPPPEEAVGRDAGARLRSPVATPPQHGPFPEVAMHSEAGVSSLGQRSAADRGPSDVDLRAVMTAAASSSIADAARARRREQQQRQRQREARAASSPSENHKKAYGTDVSNLTSDGTFSAPSGNEHDSSSSSDGDGDGDNDFLFDAVKGTLGPRGMSADLESLGGASHRSNRSYGRPRSTRNMGRGSDRSVGSRASARHHHRSGGRMNSDRSVGSRNTSRRNVTMGSEASVGSHHRRGRNGRGRPRGSSGASVGSRGSRASRASRASRGLSTSGGGGAGAGGGGSVSAALLKLEGHFEALDRGASIGGDGGSVISGRSRVSGNTSAASSRRRRPSAAATPSERMRVDVAAPPGKLGIILQNRSQNRGTVVSDVRSSSLLHGKVFPGDRIVGIDDEDVSQLTVAEITAIMARKADLHRTLAVITTRRRADSLDGEARSLAPGAGSSYNRSYR